MGNAAPGFEKHPNHTVIIEDAKGSVVLLIDGEEVLRSDKAKVLKEASYPPVYYIPLAEVPSRLITPSEHKTYCPFKGEASYWDVMTDDELKENAVWSYQKPYDEALEIKDYAAFYAEAGIITPV